MRASPMSDLYTPPCATHFDLRAGDCLAMQLDQPTMFHNPSSTPARYAVVIANGSQARR